MSTTTASSSPSSNPLSSPALLQQSPSMALFSSPSNVSILPPMNLMSPNPFASPGFPNNNSSSSTAAAAPNNSSLPPAVNASAAAPASIYTAASSSIFDSMQQQHQLLTNISPQSTHKAAAASSSSSSSSSAPRASSPALSSTGTTISSTSNASSGGAATFAAGAKPNSRTLDSMSVANGQKPPKKLKLDVGAVSNTNDEDDEDDDDDEDDEDDDDDGEPAPGGVKKKGKGGSSCHQCKSRRNFSALTYCTSNLDSKKNKRCRKKFCSHCLKKFYKENAAAITDKTVWKCPSCRKICCCAACRRRKTRDEGAAELQRDGLPTLLMTSGDLAAANPLYGSQAYEYMSTDILIDETGKKVKGGDGGEDDDSEDEESFNKNHDDLVSSSPFRQLLNAHIRHMAAEASRNTASPFLRLYRLAQQPAIQKKIKAIIQRQDLKKEKKVDLIAQILIPLQA